VRKVAGQRIRGSFRDVAELGRLFGWDLGFRQLDDGEHLIAARIVVGEHLTLVGMKFNRSFHQLGSPPRGMFTLGIPLVGLRDWFGRPYASSSILPFNHAAGIDCVSEQGFEGFTISIAEDFLQRVCAGYGIEVPNYIIEPHVNSIIGNSPATQIFRAGVSGVVDGAASGLDEVVEDELVVALLCAALSSPAITDKSQPIFRSRALHRAVAYINDNLSERMTVRDICEQNAIPLRTLNRAFRERFGVGPKSYLKRQRLSAVRTALLTSPPETRVADVANTHGFWHMGQFAKDYKEMFGELPSETLSS